MKNKKQYLVCCLGILVLAAGFCLILAVPAPRHILRTLPYICIGLGCGMFGYGVGEIVKGLALRKDPALAKQIAIEEKDERNVTLGNQARARGFKISTYVYAALMLAYALMGVSFTVILPFVAVYLFVQGYTVYCQIQLFKSN